MGVRLKLSTNFRCDINFHVLDEKGKRENLSFIAIFDRLPKEAVKELLEESQKPGVTDETLLQKVLKGWVMSDISTGEAIPFTPETLSEFCAIPGAAGLTMLRFFETVGAAREKN